MSINDLFLTILYCTLAVFPIVTAIYVTRRKRHPLSSNSPLLMREMIPTSLDTMLSTAVQTPAGYYVTCYVSSIDDPTVTGDEAAYSAYMVNLPFASGVHLIGFTHAQPYVPLGRGKFERVTLEGLYNDTFDLFVANHQQTQSRYVLDPTAMVFTLDFCSRYHWEILNDTLYFFSRDENPDFITVDEFVRQIRPAIEVASIRASSAVAQPYTAVVHALLCPICHQTLDEANGYYRCPDGHGELIDGKQLIAINEGTITIPQDIGTASPHGTLTCPNCAASMNEAEYQIAGVIINICTKCRFRWCDAGELQKLF